LIAHSFSSGCRVRRSEGRSRSRASRVAAGRSPIARMLPTGRWCRVCVGRRHSRSAVGGLAKASG
jgi:hypothetical protein